MALLGAPQGTAADGDEAEEVAAALPKSTARRMLRALVKEGRLTLSPAGAHDLEWGTVALPGEAPDEEARRCIQGITKETVLKRIDAVGECDEALTKLKVTQLMEIDDETQTDTTRETCEARTAEVMTALLDQGQLGEAADGTLYRCRGIEYSDDSDEDDPQEDALITQAYEAMTKDSRQRVPDQGAGTEVPETGGEAHGDAAAVIAQENSGGARSERIPGAGLVTGETATKKRRRLAVQQTKAGPVGEQARGPVELSDLGTAWYGPWACRPSIDINIVRQCVALDLHAPALEDDVTMVGYGDDLVNASVQHGITQVAIFAEGVNTTDDLCGHELELDKLKIMKRCGKLRPPERSLLRAIGVRKKQELVPWTLLTGVPTGYGWTDPDWFRRAFERRDERMPAWRAAGHAFHDRLTVWTHFVNRLTSYPEQGTSMPKKTRSAWRVVERSYLKVTRQISDELMRSMQYSAGTPAQLEDDTLRELAAQGRNYLILSEKVEHYATDATRWREEAKSLHLASRLQATMKLIEREIAISKSNLLRRAVQLAEAKVERSWATLGEAKTTQVDDWRAECSIHTDGSHDAKQWESGNTTGKGWTTIGPGEETLSEMMAPVFTDLARPGARGALKLNNVTAEMEAVLDGLEVNHQDLDRLRSRGAKRLLVNVDNPIGILIALGFWATPSEPALMLLLLQIGLAWEEADVHLEMTWTRSHAKDEANTIPGRGNLRADRLAEEGRRREVRVCAKGKIVFAEPAALGSRSRMEQRARAQQPTPVTGAEPPSKPAIDLHRDWEQRLWRICADRRRKAREEAKEGEAGAMPEAITLSEDQLKPYMRDAISMRCSHCEGGECKEPATHRALQELALRPTRDMVGTVKSCCRKCRSEGDENYTNEQHVDDHVGLAASIVSTMLQEVQRVKRTGDRTAEEMRYMIDRTREEMLEEGLGDLLWTVGDEEAEQAERAQEERGRTVKKERDENENPDSARWEADGTYAENEVKTEPEEDERETLEEQRAKEEARMIRAMAQGRHHPLEAAERQRHFKTMRVQTWLYALLQGAKWLTGAPQRELKRKLELNHMGITPDELINSAARLRPRKLQPRFRWTRFFALCNAWPTGSKMTGGTRQQALDARKDWDNQKIAIMAELRARAPRRRLWGGKQPHLSPPVFLRASGVPRMRRDRKGARQGTKRLRKSWTGWRLCPPARHRSVASAGNQGQRTTSATFSRWAWTIKVSRRALICVQCGERPL